jgi:hypothetical protein
VPSTTRGGASRRLDVVHVHTEAADARAPGLRVRRVAVAGGAYLVRGVRLLGAHFTAFVWTTESGDPDRGHGPRAL